MLNLHNKWIKDGGKSDQPIHHITHRSGFGGNVEPTKGRRESVRGQPEKPGATRENGRPFFHAKLDAGQERSRRKEPFMEGASHAETRGAALNRYAASGLTLFRPSLHGDPR